MKQKIASIIKPYLPAAVTGAIVLSCATAPVLRPLPDRLHEPVQQEKTQPELLDSTRPKREAEPAGDAAALVSTAFSAPKCGYRDGVYTGSARGFGGMITVQVTISGGAITAVSVLSAPGETSSYLSRATAVTGRIVSAQSPNVDGVSGATCSSEGVRAAYRSALDQARLGTETIVHALPPQPVTGRQEGEMPDER